MAEGIPTLDFIGKPFRNALVSNLKKMRPPSGPPSGDDPPQASAEKPQEPLSSSIGTTPEERVDRIRELARQLEKASPLPEPVAKRIMAEALAAAIVHLDALRERRDAGKTAREELKTWAPVINAVSKLTEELGLRELPSKEKAKPKWKK